MAANIFQSYHPINFTCYLLLSHNSQRRKSEKCTGKTKETNIIASDATFSITAEKIGFRLFYLVPKLAWHRIRFGDFRDREEDEADPPSSYLCLLSFGNLEKELITIWNESSEHWATRTKNIKSVSGLAFFFISTKEFEKAIQVIQSKITKQRKRLWNILSFKYRGKVRQTYLKAYILPNNLSK